jgi:hypothetical protein
VWVEHATLAANRPNAPWGQCWLTPLPLLLLQLLPPCPRLRNAEHPPIQVSSNYASKQSRSVSWHTNLHPWKRRSDPLALQTGSHDSWKKHTRDASLQSRWLLPSIITANGKLMHSSNNR